MSYILEILKSYSWLEHNATGEKTVCECAIEQNPMHRTQQADEWWYIVVEQLVDPPHEHELHYLYVAKW